MFTMSCFHSSPLLKDFIGIRFFGDVVSITIFNGECFIRKLELRMKYFVLGKELNNKQALEKLQDPFEKFLGQIAHRITMRSIYRRNCSYGLISYRPGTHRNVLCTGKMERRMKLERIFRRISMFYVGPDQSTDSQTSKS